LKLGARDWEGGREAGSGVHGEFAWGGVKRGGNGGRILERERRGVPERGGEYSGWKEEDWHAEVSS